MNFQGNRSVPFEISDINHGFQKAEGLLKVNEKGVELEFEVKDALVGLMSSGIKSISIPYADMESIEFRKGWINGKIILEAVSMQAFEEVPGTDVATCTLKIKRKNRDEAERLVSKARLVLSEYRLEQLDEHG